MHIRRSVIMVAATAAMLSGAALAVTAQAAPAQQRAARNHAASCPAAAKKLLPLRADSVQRAADAALAEAAHLYRGLDTRGAQVMFSARTAFAGDRGGQVTFDCGSAVAARTVVVQLLFPRELPSGSLSEAVVWAGRFAGGYYAWFVAH